jgi:hypothetical protein
MTLARRLAILVAVGAVVGADVVLAQYAVGTAGVYVARLASTGRVASARLVLVR